MNATQMLVRTMAASLLVFSCIVSSSVEAKGNSCLHHTEPQNAAGELHGVKKCFDDEAKTQQSGFRTYENGQQEGEEQSWHGKTKKLLWQAFYKNGALHGLARTFAADGGGEMTSETNYEDGKRHGRERILRRMGNSGAIGPLNRVEIETVYRDDVEVGPQRRYYESGRLQSVTHLEMNLGAFRTKVDYYETGSPKTITLYSTKFDHNEIGALHYLPNGEIERAVCSPPGQGYVHELKACQQAFPVFKTNLSKGLKDP
jgi:antitoxin component YwqK of YwqJK toxin-antitoxin module